MESKEELAWTKIGKSMLLSTKKSERSFPQYYAKPPHFLSDLLESFQHLVDVCPPAVCLAHFGVDRFA